MGRDRTKEVLVERKEIHVGGPAPPVKEKSPPGKRGPYLGARAGAAVPLGSFFSTATSFRDEAATGFAVDATLDWRTSRHDVYGVLGKFAEFGGERSVEDVLASGTSGSIDQIRYRHWGLAAMARWLILPERRIDPFLHTAIGIGGFTTTLSGPGGTGSHTSFAWSQELGAGLSLRLDPRTNVDVLAALTSADVSEGKTTVGAVSQTLSGTIQYLQIKVGIVRRLRGE
jgi:hypothetical protein